jgi:hypothetical protein
MSFGFDGVWRCHFREGKIAIGRPLQFKDEAKLRQLVNEGNGVRNSEDRCMFDLAIQHRGGGLFLHLTPEQYTRLKGSGEQTTTAARERRR